SEYTMSRFFAWRERTTGGDRRRHRLTNTLGELTSPSAGAAPEAEPEPAIQIDGERCSFVLVKDAPDQAVRPAPEGTEVEIALAELGEGQRRRPRVTHWSVPASERPGQAAWPPRGRPFGCAPIDQSAQQADDVLESTSARRARSTRGVRPFGAGS